MRLALLRLLRLADATPAEREATVWTAIAFFCVLFAYYLLRPLRENVAAAFGPDQLLPLFLLTFVLVTLLNQPYAALVRRLPSHRFLPYGLHAFAASFAGLALLFAGQAGKLGELGWGTWRGSGYAFFYSWVTAFSVCGVTLVWVHAVEWFSMAQGKRLFGLISVGGTLGAMTGSSLSSSLAKVDYGTLCLLGALGIELAVVTWWLSLRACRRMESAPRPRMSAEPSSFLANGRRVVRDPYLRGIAAFVLLAAVLATTFYYQQVVLVREQLSDEAERRVLMAEINWWQNALALSMQLLFTSRALLYFGLGIALSAMPFVSLAGLATLSVWPIAGVYAVVEVVRRMVQFGFDKPAREVLYTPLDVEAKYVSKAVVDTAVLRLGDVVGAVLNDLLLRARASGGTLFAAAVPLLVLWAWIGRWLGRRCRQYDEAQRPSTS